MCIFDTWSHFFLIEYYRIEGQINKQVIEGRRTNQFIEIVKFLAKVQSLFVLSVMNNFPSEDKEFQLCTSMFQNMFPSINPTKVKVNSIRRCVLLNYNKDTKMIDFRHYTIKVVPTGLNKGVKKLVTARGPDLGRMQDMGEFMEKGGGVSESEDVFAFL